LRLRPGARVLLWDGEGTEHEALLRAYEGGVAAMTVVRSYRPQRESPLAVTLAQAVGKGDKMDWIVEKSTELGVACVAPFFSSHTVPRFAGGKGQRRRERWEKIAAAAARQCGRTRIPEVRDAVPFDAVLARDWRCEAKLFLWEGLSGRGLAPLREELGSLRSVLVMVGPEGGFSKEEAASAAAHGFHTAALGKRILRTETAAVAAVCAVQLLWGDLG
jgi:16S rRNA (uracil1498-N3)-methyltransferase